MLLADTTERAHVTQKLLVQRSLFMPTGIYLMVQQLTCYFLACHRAQFTCKETK